MKNTLLFLLCLSAKMLLAQTDIENNDFIVLCSEKDTNKTIVFTIFGLKIREQPNQMSKVIGLVPHGQKITRLTRKQNPASPEFTSDSIIGNWEQVQYKNVKGYIFYGEGILQITDKFTLLLEDKGWCQHDNYSSPFGKTYYYITLFSKDSCETTLKKFKPTFLSYSSEVGNGTRIICNDKRESGFIIATTDKMKEGKIKNAKSYDKILFKRDEFQYNYQITEAQLPNSTLYFEIKKDRFREKNPDGIFETVEDNVLYLKDKKTGKAQKIQRVHSECIKLIWKGDLDNDGKDDFLLHFNGKEYDNFLQLYLTKGAKQIVIPSSKYYLIDCY